MGICVWYGLHNPYVFAVVVGGANAVEIVSFGYGTNGIQKTVGNKLRISVA
jgi:hypothetical protein